MEAFRSFDILAVITACQKSFITCLIYLGNRLRWGVGAGSVMDMKAPLLCYTLLLLSGGDDGAPPNNVYRNSYSSYNRCSYSSYNRCSFNVDILLLLLSRSFRGSRNLDAHGCIVCISGIELLTLI